MGSSYLNANSTIIMVRHASFRKHERSSLFIKGSELCLGLFNNCVMVKLPTLSLPPSSSHSVMFYSQEPLALRCPNCSRTNINVHKLFFSTIDFWNVTFLNVKDEMKTCLFEIERKLGVVK